MVKFVDLGVLYFSLVLPRQARWPASWIVKSLGGMGIRRREETQSGLPVRGDAHARVRPL